MDHLGWRVITNLGRKNRPIFACLDTCIKTKKTYPSHVWTFRKSFWKCPLKKKTKEGSKDVSTLCRIELWGGDLANHGEVVCGEKESTPKKITQESPPWNFRYKMKVAKPPQIYLGTEFFEEDNQFEFPTWSDQVCPRPLAIPKFHFILTRKKF